MKHFFLTIVLLVNYGIYAQSIQTALHFNKNQEFNSDKLVAETTTYITFYDSKSIEKKKYVTAFNNHNRVTAELRYDENGKLTQRLTRTYDSTGVRSLARKFENWHPLMGHFFEIAYHEYDFNGALNRIIEKDQNNNIIRETNIVNNEKGNPTELILLVEGQIQGKETAEYDYEKNKVNIKYFNKNEELIHSENADIDFEKHQPGDIVNEHGDVIKSANYQMEIKYDKYGNWIRKVRSTIIDGKLVKKSESTRIIKYQK